MKILNESEIKNLCDKIKYSATETINKQEAKKLEKWKKSKEEYDKRRKVADDQYNAQLENYYKQLYEYEARVAKEEEDYIERVKKWEASEEQIKASVDRTNLEMHNAYERSKREHETAGIPFKLREPQDIQFHPTPKPKKTKFVKPTKPSYPVVYGNVSSTPDILSEKQKEDIIRSDFRNLYINKRESMECTPEELYGTSAASGGSYGEKLTVFELELCIYYGFKGIILHNLEFEIGNKTIQIDILFITTKGILVIESKNYSGRISGAEHQDKWTLSTPRKEYKFYNPFKQNQIHINILSKIVHNQKFFSLIVFSERCKLDYIDIHSHNVFVFQRFAMKDVIKDIFSDNPDVMTFDNVKEIAAVFQKYCVDEPSSPNYKESKSYYSSKSRVNNNNSNEWFNDQLKNMFRQQFNSFRGFDFSFDDDYDDDYDYDYDDYDD